MKLITDEGKVYSMVPAENGKLENDVQLYIGGVRYVGEVIESENDKTKDDIIFSMVGESDGWQTTYTYDEVKKGMDDYAAKIVFELSKQQIDFSCSPPMDIENCKILISEL